MTALPYRTPAAFRAALTDRLKTIAAESAFTVPELQRQFAYDRLLARLFSAADAERWVLKGAVSLLARLDQARHSKDVDLAWRADTDVVEAEQALRLAAGQDLGDFFLFSVGQASELTDHKGIRILIGADLGGRQFARFPVDVVAGVLMTDMADLVPPLVCLDIPGLTRPWYRVYPIVDHVADKVAACLETHVSASGETVASTRYKDLVDLVLIACTQRLEAQGLRIAVISEITRRGLSLPVEFAVPGGNWAAGYAAKSRDVGGLEYPDLSSALDLVKRMIDPVLAGATPGRWDPDGRRWLEA
jgi:hypothetical protein